MPMNATEYLTDQGPRALVRDPKSVRTWPLQQMPGFRADARRVTRHRSPPVPSRMIGA
jgi:hypothetical protein